MSVTDDVPRHEFLARAEELCDALYTDVQELRRASSLSPRERRALLDRAFRDAHTLKGTSSALPALSAVSRLAHELENLLEAMRASRLSPRTSALDACEDAAETLSRAVASASRDAPPPDISEALARLRRVTAMLTGRDGPGAPPHKARPPEDETRVPLSPSPPPAAPRQSATDQSPDARAAPSRDHLPAGIDALLNADERRRIAQALAEGARLLLCEVAFDLADFDERFRRLTDALAASSEIVSTLPAAPGAVAPARIGFRLICAAEEPRSLAHVAAEFDARLTELSTNGEVGNEHVADERSSAGVSTDRARAGDAAPSSFVRVQLSELDELIFAANELFDDATRALEDARAESSAARPRPNGETAARVRRELVALVERVMALRMQPIGRTLERAARAARVAARRAGKRVEFEFAGGEARVDRAVAERLAAPLEHLLRNAVAHGIESPTERRKAGKDSRGRVRVEASVEGSRVRVTVADDGRGIDVGRVEEAARAQGLVGEGAGLAEEQALRLIFRPGFSTARDVSQSAGRGVGLDAVEHEIEGAGGEVRVRTRAARGTTFELRLPLALALVEAVLVRAGRHAYAIDAGRVVGTLALDAQTADDEESRRTLLWRGSRVPLVALRELIGRGASSDSESSRVIVVRADGARVRDLFDDADSREEYAALGGDATPEGEGRGEREGRDDTKQEVRTGAGGQSPPLVAVSVDLLIGRREVLVRTLGRHAKRWRGVAGAIDLRDGTVALMLDLPRLLER